MAAKVAGRARRALGILVDILTGVFIAVLLACVIAQLAFGVRAFAVLTSSMTPTLSAGDLVVSVPASFEDINENDVITYVLNSDLDVVTHRVVGKNVADQTLITKGDANSSVDGSPVAYRNVVGVVRASVPRFGNTLRFLSTPTGKIIGVTVVLALVIALIIVRLLVGMYERDDDELSADDMTRGPVQGSSEADDVVSKARPTMGAGRVGVTEGDSQRLGERRRSAIAAVIAAEFDDEWDDDDAEWENDASWDEDDDDLDEDDDWNGDFTGDDVIFDTNDEYDKSNAADGARPS